MGARNFAAPDSIDMRTSTHAPRASWHAGERIYAALDLGTNNCRLLIAVPQYSDKERTVFAAPPLKVLDSFSRIVRLGEGVAQTGKLSEDAMKRTEEALAACWRKLEKYPVSNARFVATEACRRASNSHEFLWHIRKNIGLDIEIISGEEEARLAFLGCASLLTQQSERAVVFDIGGGSTELLWIDVKHAHHEQEEVHPISDWLSINYGVMNLADKFGGTRLADMAYDDMVGFIASKIKPFDVANRISETIKDQRVQLLSTSGTVTTLAAIHLGLPKYDRSRIDGITLKVADLRATTQKLLSMRPSERFYHSCIGADRADFIISGCAIFDAISALWPEGEITIADRGVREGIILSLIGDDV